MGLGSLGVFSSSPQLRRRCPEAPQRELRMSAFICDQKGDNPKPAGSNERLFNLICRSLFELYKSLNYIKVETQMLLRSFSGIRFLAPLNFLLYGAPQKVNPMSY